MSWHVLTKCVILSALVVMVTRGDEGHAHAEIPPDQRPTNFNDPKFTQDEE